ncbi:anaerobic ribonucleoside-triphosphate reductase activating protein [Treponema parvum]|uniref:Anaerobic ribonucleoside-triphosphate reductase activating protein n=2 Tax=Treponema parvum TaxID=138851 RepID=A0A975F5S9_9SPIR|nr:anaerobic ribonucleoside-triphosphate reductase activating protein [Treponema parvum]
MPAGALIKTTLVDYPGRVACSFFLKGCNIRCPYCYNRALVLEDETDGSLVSAETVIAHLEKRKNVLTGFVLSGGEPLLNPLTPFLIGEARKKGYKIKLDTNGTLPDLLEKLVSDPALKPDFIAMDIKTSPNKYAELLSPCSRALAETMEDRLKQSVNIIASYPPTLREFRTVLVPPLVSAEDIKNMGALLPKDASWQFAQFRNENCINPSYNEITPYSDKEIEDLVGQAKELIAGAALR